jgi:hypothetical protein
MVVNTKRSTVDYHLYPSSTVSKFGLASSVKIYETDLSTVLKQVDTEYSFDSAYINRRIIGLPTEVESHGHESTGLNLMSRVTYAYDEGDFSDSSLAQNISPTQHDGTLYGSSFVAGRGNLTSVTRWDATAPTNSASAISSSVKYNAAGSVVAQITPWDGANTRTVKIAYADVWNDSVSRTTYAYPTTVNRSANNQSTVKYRYDIGANVEATSPAPAGQSYGKTTKRVFDSIGRLQRDSIYVNTTEHSYSRYEYPWLPIEQKAYATLVDVDNDGNIAEDEVLSESWTDGAGRIRLSRKPHTFSGGSTATWAGTITEYDILGRVKRQSRTNRSKFELGCNR